MCGKGSGPACARMDFRASGAGIDDAWLAGAVGCDPVMEWGDGFVSAAAKLGSRGLAATVQPTGIGGTTMIQSTDH